MDPASIAFTIGTIFLTKALEKSGEKLGEATIAKLGQSLAKIWQHAPEVAGQIEAGDPQVLNLGTATLEQIPVDPIFAELAAALDAERNTTFQEQFQALKAGGTITTIGKQINVTQTGTGNTQSNTFSNF